MMGNKTLLKHQSDHLILLVGGNPLPNAVAGRLLVEDGGRITLLHTVDTRTIADRLKIWFTQQGMAKNKIDVRGIDRTHRSAILATVEQVVAKDEKGVGLNYTSGTSAMSVHVHTAVSQRASNPICSYLDGRSLCMVFDDGATSYVGLYSKFQLSIEGLFHLHGWEVKSQKTPPFNQKYTPADAPQIYNGDGRSFERAVYQQLLQIKETRDLSDIWTSTFAEKDGITSEFDVLALRGYQLFYLSCAIIEPYKDYSPSGNNEFKKNKRNEIKQKLFEAFIRARQLGGDEACAALVCYADDPTIEIEVQQTLQIKDRVKVFGRKHLPKLSQHLSKWIKEQSREGKPCPEINYS